MKRDFVSYLLILTLGIVSGVLWIQQYVHRFPLRYVESDTCHSLFKDVKGLYNTNSVV